MRRWVWAPVGERPTALGHHRFEWLYVTAFVAPSSRETVWYLSNGIDKRLYEMMLASFGEALDWSEFDMLMVELRSAPTERPGWPPLSMLKALLLAQWYGLSDPELEDTLADRLSFRRFVGLPLDGGVPDETTLCRFPGELCQRGLTGRLLPDPLWQLVSAEQHVALFRSAA